MIAWYGPYKFGNVIPESVPRSYGTDPAQLVSIGTLQATDKPTNCTIFPPKLVPQSDGSKEMREERNDLHKRVEQAEMDANLSAAKITELESLLKTRDRVHQKLLEENTHLTTACEDHQGTIERLEKSVVELKGENAGLKAEVAGLRADLETATAPKSEPKKAKQPQLAATH